MKEISLLNPRITWSYLVEDGDLINFVYVPQVMQSVVTNYNIIGPLLLVVSVSEPNCKVNKFGKGRDESQQNE